MTTKTFGQTYVPSLDRDRITGQMRDVLDLMIDGQWRTLKQITEATGAPESSAGAQLRHLKKDKFGSYQLNKKRDVRYPGLWLYQILPPVPVQDGEQLNLLVAAS